LKSFRSSSQANRISLGGFEAATIASSRFRAVAEGLGRSSGFGSGVGAATGAVGRTTVAGRSSSFPLRRRTKAPARSNPAAATVKNPIPRFLARNSLAVLRRVVGDARPARAVGVRAVPGRAAGACSDSILWTTSFGVWGRFALSFSIMSRIRRLSPGESEGLRDRGEGGASVRCRDRSSSGFPWKGSVPVAIWYSTMPRE
jgi:hypothetical protein